MLLFRASFSFFSTSLSLNFLKFNMGLITPKLLSAQAQEMFAFISPISLTSISILNATYFKHWTYIALIPVVLSFKSVSYLISKHAREVNR